MHKYYGIDQRQIKCCDSSRTTIEGGISFDSNEDGQNILMFSFLEVIVLENQRTFIHQTTKSMWLDKENTKELIKALRGLKFKKTEIQTIRSNDCNHNQYCDQQTPDMKCKYEKGCNFKF